MKKIISAILAIALLLTFSGCQQKSPYIGYNKYRYQFFGTFDTIVEIVAYTQSEQEFDFLAKVAENRFQYLHQLYTTFEDVEGLANLKMVNDNAGVAPVQVDPALYDLMTFATDWYNTTNQIVDPTMGALTEIWRTQIALYRDNPEEATLPDLKTLEAANKHTNMDYLLLDADNQTIFITQPGTRLDVGAFAKGFAVEQVATYLLELGFESFSISAGGNVRTVGEPMSDTVCLWGVGIQDPKGEDVLSKENDLLDIAFVKDTSVVTSGDYQRFYMLNDQKIHHIIDKDTLYPANKYASVTIILPHSGQADMLSTSLYIMEYADGLALANSLNAQVLWVFPDGTIKATDGITPLLKKRGGATSARE